MEGSDTERGGDSDTAKSQVDTQTMLLGKT